jgi:hypothetical protein
MGEQQNRSRTLGLRPRVNGRQSDGRLAGEVTWALDTPAPRPRVVRFPKNRSLGDLYVEPVHTGDRRRAEGEELGRAWGEVVVPAGKRRDLRPLTKLAPWDLQALNLSRCEIKDADLVYLRGLTWLEDLDLSCNRFTGVGLGHLGGMLLLKRLDLYGGDLTDEGLGHLPALPSLRELSLAIHFALTDGALVHLNKFPALEELSLGNTPVGDGGIDYLKRLKALRHLDISYTRFSRDGADRLRAALPRCNVHWQPSAEW